MYTYRTKSIEERLWITNIANKRGLIREYNVDVIFDDINSNDDWVRYPYVVFYPTANRFDLRRTDEIEVGLSEFLNIIGGPYEAIVINRYIKEFKFI